MHFENLSVRLCRHTTFIHILWIRYLDKMKSVILFLDYQISNLGSEKQNEIQVSKNVTYLWL